MIMMAEEDDVRPEIANPLEAARRMASDFRKRVDRLEHERVQFIDHIADLRIAHEREVDRLVLQIRDLHQLVARLQLGSA
jgi:hypothetical protein